jgi:hypothetical protein
MSHCSNNDKCITSLAFFGTFNITSSPSWKETKVNKLSKRNNHFRSHLDLALALVTTRLQIFQQQLVLGDPLHWFDEVRRQRVFQFMFALDFVEKGAAILDDKVVGKRFVLTIEDIPAR